jgi:hypothetical protein
VKPWKLVFGVPFYGYEWTNVPNIDDGLFEPGSPLGQGSAYNFIVTIESQFQKRRDSITYEPWLYDGTNSNRPAHFFVSGAGGGSRFSRVEFPYVQGSSTSQSPARARDFALVGVAFRL